MRPLAIEADDAQIGSVLDALTSAGDQRLARDGFPPHRRQFRRAALARYVGQSSEIEVDLPEGDIAGSLAARFGDAHERNYGFRAPVDEPVELIGLSVIARGTPERSRLPENIPPPAIAVPASRRTWFPDTGWIEAPVVNRADLARRAVEGPVVIQEYDATCLVPHRWRASLDDFGNIRLN